MAKIPCSQVVENMIATEVIIITSHTPVSGEAISGSLADNGYIWQY